ncbi:hypothetical protein ACPUVO_16260 [Pseudocolwellia sp. HL-MZ19]|uniref:hypothetical protein n=1 Tax=Pseudocolwellia sp. HL-MZ19 TaxID=3400846 RepID=UPI003CE8E8D5
MKSTIFLFFIILLTACSASKVPFAPIAKNNKAEAVQVIKQIMYEQWPQTPQKINFYTDHMEVYWGEQSYSKVNYNNITSNSKAIISRIYFNSLAEPKLFTKRDRFIAQIITKQGKVLMNIVSIDEARFKEFINSFMFFIK